MTMPGYPEPKVWYETKRGIGMAMAAISAVLPVIMTTAGGWLGINVDMSQWSEFSQNVAKWFDLTWTLVGYVLWVYGSFRPTAPIVLRRAEEE